MSKLQDVFGRVEHVDDIPINDLSMSAGLINNHITEVVRKLSLIPIPEINELVKLFESLVSDNVCPVAVAPIPMIGFWGEQEPNKKMISVVMIPYDWIKLFKENPIYQSSGVVFAASQCKDYWNQKLNAESIDRAQSYEAFFLRSINPDASYVMNDYQKHILKKFPEFYKPYVGKKYDKVGPPFPVDVKSLCSKP